MNDDGTMSLLDSITDEVLLKDYPWLGRVFGRRAAAKPATKEGGRLKSEEIATEFSASPFYDAKVAEAMIATERAKK